MCWLGLLIEKLIICLSLFQKKIAFVRKGNGLASSIKGWKSINPPACVGVLKEFLHLSVINRENVFTIREPLCCARKCAWFPRSKGWKSIKSFSLSCRLRAIGRFSLAGKSQWTFVTGICSAFEVVALSWTSSSLFSSHCTLLIPLFCSQKLNEPSLICCQFLIC